MPSAPVMLRSRKEPASTATLPATVQDVFEATRQLSAVLDMFPGAPRCSVTVTGFACREKTVALAATAPKALATDATLMHCCSLSASLLVPAGEDGGNV